MKVSFKDVPPQPVIPVRTYTIELSHREATELREWLGTARFTPLTAGIFHELNYQGA